MPAVDDRLPGVKETVLILVYRLDIASVAIFLQSLLAHFEGCTSSFDAVIGSHLGIDSVIAYEVKSESHINISFPATSSMIFLAKTGIRHDIYFQL